ncbi:MAG TPA: Fic family protein [Rhodoferax sp.]
MRNIKDRQVRGKHTLKFKLGRERPRPAGRFCPMVGEQSPEASQGDCLRLRGSFKQVSSQLARNVPKFLWLNVAYLQPFEDGNKRTSRLCANLPLMLSNCAPLSFLDVERADYALSVMGVYERLDVTMAVELFEWTYRRSIAKYKVILESMGAPDPFRARYREHLGDAIRQVVDEGATVTEAVAALSIPAADQESFQAVLRRELQNLEPFNCARYRLAFGKTEGWIKSGRPM